MHSGTFVQFHSSFSSPIILEYMIDLVCAHCHWFGFRHESKLQTYSCTWCKTPSPFFLMIGLKIWLPLSSQWPQWFYTLVDRIFIDCSIINYKLHVLNQSWQLWWEWVPKMDNNTQQPCFLKFLAKKTFILDINQTTTILSKLRSLNTCSFLLNAPTNTWSELDVKKC
jgi:hypothetical protein